MAKNPCIEDIDTEIVKKTLKRTLHPKHKLFVKDDMILIHREDAFQEKGWLLVKLCMSPFLHLDRFNLTIYDNNEEYKWRVILWERKH